MQEKKKQNPCPSLPIFLNPASLNSGPNVRYIEKKESGGIVWCDEWMKPCAECGDNDEGWDGVDAEEKPRSVTAEAKEKGSIVKG